MTGPTVSQGGLTPARLLRHALAGLALLVAHTAPAVAASPGAPEDGSVLSVILGTRPAWGPSAGDRAVTSMWGWPLAGQPRVVDGFDPPEQRWLAGHRGIDLAGIAGEPVLAVDAGVVAYSGDIAGVGIVSVDHASGLRSTYQPVSERVVVGTRVARGDRLGRLDTGGHCLLVDCLHLGARRGQHHYVDPLPLLQPVELSLLALESGRGVR